MERYISATKDQRQKLMKIFGCGERMIRKALSYRSESLLAKKIRIAAEEDGCHTYVAMEEMECWHDSDNMMHQLFPNGAKIEIDKTSGKGIIYHKGIRVVEKDEVYVSDLSELQEIAKAL